MALQVLCVCCGILGATLWCDKAPWGKLQRGGSSELDFKGGLGRKRGAEMRGSLSRTWAPPRGTYLRMAWQQDPSEHFGRHLKTVQWNLFVPVTAEQSWEALHRRCYRHAIHLVQHGWWKQQKYRMRTRSSAKASKEWCCCQREVTFFHFFKPRGKTGAISAAAGPGGKCKSTNNHLRRAEPQTHNLFSLF